MCVFVCACNKNYHPVHTIHLNFGNACKNILKIGAKEFPIFLSYQLTILSIPAITLCCTVATLDGTQSSDARQSLWRIPLSTERYVVVSTKQTFKHLLQKNVTFQNKEHKIKIYYNARRE